MCATYEILNAILHCSCNVGIMPGTGLLWSLKTRISSIFNRKAVFFSFFSFLNGATYSVFTCSVFTAQVLILILNATEKSYKWIEVVHTWMLLWKWDYLCFAVCFRKVTTNHFHFLRSAVFIYFYYFFFSTWWKRMATIFYFYANEM